MHSLDVAKAVTAIRSDGFAIVPQIATFDQVAAMKAALAAAVDEDLAAWRGRDYVNANMVLNLMTRGLPFVRLLENESLHRILTPLLGDTCIVYAYTSSSMPPGGSNYSRRIHVDCPRLIPGYITNVGVTLALDDFTSENGAMEVLPASFEREDAPTEQEFSERHVAVLPRAGDAVVFNARTWHRGGVNATKQYRHAATLNVCRSFMRQQFDFPRMVGQEVLENVGELGKRFLGFNVRMPGSLEEYYLPSELRPYRPNQG